VLNGRKELTGGRSILDADELRDLTAHSDCMCDETKENETDGTCGQCGGDEECIQCFGGEKVKETGHWVDLGVNGFRRILKKWDDGLIWLRIGRSYRLL
jgi:hypothetical protein